MPIIDDERGVLVLRLVYDGPPRSGKTTTLRTLARGFGVDAITPEERDGRTMYFDWVDYVGGIFEGRRIRCQIVSVPGQEELSSRRQHLLETADAIVLVADSTPQPFAEALAILRELLPACRSQRPPTGIVVQANKRDAPDALARAEVRDRLDAIAPIALTETVATSGEGIREAFVFAVRLALDRVRALSDLGLLRHGRPSIDDAATLLSEMRGLPVAVVAPPPGAAVPPAPSAAVPLRVALPPEAAVPPAETPPARAIAAPTAAPAISVAAAPVLGDERPFAPDPMMPGGFIWPPVDGRALLHEVARLALVPERTARGDWSASGGGWRFHSRAHAIYGDVNSGRAALIAWARVHASSARLLSAGRALILADAGDDRVRLWQLVRVEAPLREVVTEAATKPPRQVVHALVFATMQLVRAKQLLGSARTHLPCTLWTVGSDAMRQPVFVGLMPEAGEPSATDEDLVAVVRRELGPVLHRLSADRADFAEIVRGLALTGDVSDVDGVRALARVAAAVATETSHPS